MSTTIPSREAELRDYANTVSGKLSSSPTTYGFAAAADVQPLVDAAAAFSAALDVCLDPETKTRPATLDKNLKKAVLLAVLRSFIAQVTADPAVTATAKAELGIQPRPEPAPVPPPGTSPVLYVVGVKNLDVVVRFFDELTPTRRKRPAGAAGCAIYTFVGETAPSDIEQWRHEGLATRSEFTIGMNAADAGKTIWIAGRWYSGKGQFGPLGELVTAVIAKAEAA